MMVLHARLVHHFPVKVFWVGVNDFHVIIALCRLLLQWNLINFRFGIVIIVDWLER